MDLGIQSLLPLWTRSLVLVFVPLFASIEQIRRSTCTTLVYTDELCSALALPHTTGRMVPSPNSLSSSMAFPRLHVLISPPSPPLTTTTTTTTDPSPPQILHTSTPASIPGLNLTRIPRSRSSSRSRSPPNDSDFSWLSHLPDHFELWQYRKAHLLF